MSEQKEYQNAESVVRLESNGYNQGTQNAQLIHEILNSAINWKPIIDKIKEGKARDISDEPKAIINKTCFILGSGPSLDDSIQYLKDWEGGIICTPSHALTLMYYNIEPTHILLLDPFEQWKDLKGIDWGKTRTKLIMHPGCYPDIIENWPNDILLYLENAGRPDSFYQNEQQKMYSWRTGDFRQSTFNFYVRTSVTIFACSPPMELFIGEVLGYEKFFLAGCDFAYHSNKERFTDYTIKEKWIDISSESAKKDNEKQIQKQIEWIKNEHPFNLENPNLVKTDSGLLSEMAQLYYLKNFMSAWRLCGKTIYSTDHGAAIQIPYHDIKAVIKKQGDFPRQAKFFIDKTVEEYLAKTGAFVIETSRGVSFIESMDAEIEMPFFMQGIKNRYHCDVCGSKLTANPVLYKLKYNDKEESFDDPTKTLERYEYLKVNDHIEAKIDIENIFYLDHLNEECPMCKKGKLARDVDIDIEKNMARIKSRLPKKE